MEKPTYQPKLELQQITSIVAPELHSFIAEHAIVSQLMDKVREGYDEQVYQQALAEIGAELDHHFLFEEAYILPRLEKHISAQDVGPIVKLKSEHALIRKHHEEVLQMFTERDPEHPSKDMVQKMSLLAYLIKKHIEKEDHYLFPMVSVILTQQEKAEIALDVRHEEMRRAVL